MKIFIFSFLLCFQLFSCPEDDIYGAPQLSPNFEILTSLRDSGANVEQALKDMSLGKNLLSPTTLVNWDDGPKEQIMLFGKYLRKAIHEKQKGFLSVGSYQNPREEALKHFDSQVKAYHKALYSHRRQWDFNNIIKEVEMGETLYFVKDMQNSEHGIQIQYQREYGEEGFIKPLFIMSHITVSGSIPHRLDGRKARVMMKNVTPPFWKDFNYQLWELYIKPVN